MICNCVISWESSHIILLLVVVVILLAIEFFTCAESVAVSTAILSAQVEKSTTYKIR